MGRITIKDIAKLLEVNPSTVSRALKDHPDISVSMKERIQQVAKDLGYQPNYQAIRFRQNKSGLIGLIIPEMGMFFFPAVVKAIEEIVKNYEIKTSITKEINLNTLINLINDVIDYS